MNSSERVAAEIRQAQYDQLVSDMRPSTARDPGGGGGAVGGGIGNLAGWVTFGAMLGGLVGAILGGIAGAVVGAIVVALFMAGLRILARGGGSGTISRLSVLLWVVGGAIAGAVIGALIAGGDPVRGANAITNWAIFGALFFGGWRMWKRMRG